MIIDFEFNEKYYSLEIQDTNDYKIKEILFLKERGFIDTSFHIRIIAISKLNNKKFGVEIKVYRHQHSNKDFNLNEFINYYFKQQVKELFKN